MRHAPIILLHGFASTTHMLGPLGRYLERSLGREVLQVPLSPLRGDLRASAQRVADVLDRLARSRHFRYADVVGHSMGGLVGAHLLKRIDRGRRVRLVVTLGAPHRGAPLARLGALLLGGFSRALRQMRPGSVFVRELAELPVPHGSQLVSLAAENDRIVPDPYATLPARPRHHNARVRGANHVQLLWVKASRSRVRAVLEAPASLCSGAWDGSAASLPS
jgi:pimeloyl-ACP methyl ester carboxylesterase